MGLKKFSASLFGANSLKEEIKEDSKTETKKEDSKTETKKEDENLLKAIEFYKKAASQGHAEAKYKLGMYYKDGHGVKQSYYEAFKLFESAAYYEHREAQYELAMLYDKGYEDGQTGHSRTNDIKRYLRTLAEKGYLKAKYELGKFYYFEYDEKRFPKDYELAFDCFWQVADLIEYKYPEYINTVYDSHTQFYLGLFFKMDMEYLKIILKHLNIIKTQVLKVMIKLNMKWQFFIRMDMEQIKIIMKLLNGLN